MAVYTFSLQDVENEIVKRLGESTTQTILDEDNEDRIVPMFWTSVTDIIVSGEYKEEDIAGLIDETSVSIADGSDDIGEIDLGGITDNDGNTLSMLRYHDIYSKPGASGYLQKIIKFKNLDFIKQILGGDPRADSEVYVYKVTNKLKFFKDNGEVSGDVIGKNVNVVFVKSPKPTDETGDVSNLLTTYSLGFVYKAIDLTVQKIKQERQ